MTVVLTNHDEQEFEALFQEFVGASGGDWTTCPDEDYERAYRLTQYCKHGVKRHACKHGCKVVVLSSSVGWGYPGHSG
jgi:hypothetical protein